MRSLIQISVTFEVEDEDSPNRDRLIQEVEQSLRDIDGVDEVAADLARSTRRYQLVAEIEGHNPDASAATLEMEQAVRRVVKVAEEPIRHQPWVLEEIDD